MLLFIVSWSNYIGAVSAISLLLCLKILKHKYITHSYTYLVSSSCTLFYKFLFCFILFWIQTSVPNSTEKIDEKRERECVCVCVCVCVFVCVCVTGWGASLGKWARTRLFFFFLRASKCQSESPGLCLGHLVSLEKNSLLSFNIDKYI